MENLIALWRDLPSHITPWLFQIGAFQLRWYSLMYLAAFLSVYLLIMRRIKVDGLPYTAELVQDFFTWAIFGVIFGGRLGYVLFYNLDYYLQHPLEIILPFQFEGGIRFIGISGMSYHGGAIAVLLAGIIFCWKRGIEFWRFADLFASAIPLGYTFGRIGNFINGELYGRPTDVPWGMLFPLDPRHLLRHPSQLYEAFFEGIVLFVILWAIRKKFSFTGAIVACYIAGYGFIRFFIEFFREPDSQLGFVYGPFSMGQILCIAMILTGAAIYQFRKKQSGKNH
ncbi:MAG: prolipoprotein diacylglyceryl transferase [Syntrophales bacterium]